MGLFTSPKQRLPYVPPLGRANGDPADAPSSSATMLGSAPPADNDWLSRLAPTSPGGREPDPNIVLASDPNPGPPADGAQIAQQRPPQNPNRSVTPQVKMPSETARGDTVLAGRDPSKFHLKFNGRFLQLYNGDDVVAQWPGVSGRENFGSGKDQEKANYGPIPEGTYDIKQGRYQHIDAKGALYGLVPPVLRRTGEWPGSIMGWGTERVWADPTKETVENGLTFGRKDMAIHGGWTPGSAGCIDLTGNMESFAKTFRSLGRDLKLYVDYSQQPP